MMHTLAHVTVTCTNTLTGERQQLTTTLAVNRPKTLPPHAHTTTPVELDMQMNRFGTAQCLMDALTQSAHDGFSHACDNIINTIASIRSSLSATQPYCRDLVSDLSYCMDCVKDSYSFNIAGGKHIAVAVATMYLLERSTGAARIIMGSSTTSTTHDNSTSSSNNNKPQQQQLRNTGYGYMTAYQESESEKAGALVSEKLLSRYLPLYEDDDDDAPSPPPHTTATGTTHPLSSSPGAASKVMQAYLPQPLSSTTTTSTAATIATSARAPTSSSSSLQVAH